MCFKSHSRCPSGTGAVKLVLTNKATANVAWILIYWARNSQGSCFTSPQEKADSGDRHPFSWRTC